MTLRDEQGVNQVFAPIGSTVPRAARRHRWFAAQAARLGATRCLELGCGTGEAAAHMAHHTDGETLAIDISGTFIEHARAQHRAPGLRFERFDMLADDPACLGRFDLVFGNGILHHLVADLPRLLRRLRGIVTPGGGMAFIEPNLLNPYCAAIFGTRLGRRLARLDPGEMAFTPGRLRGLVAEAGWRDITVTTADFLLPGLPGFAVRPLLAIEPALEATALTRWLAQSHFLTARA